MTDKVIRPEPDADRVLRAHKLEPWLPVVALAVGMVMAVASSVARLVLR